MTPDQPTIRLRPAGHSDTPPARTYLTNVTVAGVPGSTPLREWHLLTPTQRRATWFELVDWVIWLHDRYELAVEHRLPHCWAQHPGLIEELLALKAWREQIYAADVPSGQAARYWHTELRQVLHAATAFYAKGCRAGHKKSSALAAADVELQQRWRSQDPLVGVPPQLLTGTGDTIAGDPTVISEVQMRAAIETGQAAPVSATIDDFIRYQDTWWTPLPGEHAWQQITDPILAAELDASAQRLRIADALVEDHQRLRDAL